MIKKTLKLTLLLVLVLAVSFLFDWERETVPPPKEEVVKEEEETPLKEEDLKEEDEAPLKEEEEKIIEKELPQVSIIIDDLGNSFSVDRTIEEIDANLTLAVLPFRGDTKKVVEFFKNKQEIILHLPLEPISEDQKEEKMITTSMDREEIRDFLHKALEEVDAEGVNNHKGSLFTADEDSMRMLLEEMESLFFVDSFTIGTSKVVPLAKEMGIKNTKRDIFLDNSRNVEDIRNELYKLINLAEEKGSAIAIGHSFPETISVLREEIPKIKDRVEFVHVSNLLE